MKQFSASLLFLACTLFSLPGCKMLLDTNPDKPVIQAPPMKVTEKTKPIQPDEVTPANAGSKARQLLQELETDGKD